jgi:hypothetical protein
LGCENIGLDFGKLHGDGVWGSIWHTAAALRGTLHTLHVVCMTAAWRYTRPTFSALRAVSLVLHSTVCVSKTTE